MSRSPFKISSVENNLGQDLERLTFNPGSENDNEVDKENSLKSSTSRKGKENYEPKYKKKQLKGRKGKKLKQMELLELQRKQEKEIRKYIRSSQRIIPELIAAQNAILGYESRLSLVHIDALHKFQKKLLTFEEAIQNLNSNMVVFTEIPAKLVIIFNNDIAVFTTVLANFYTFLIKEYLCIINETKQSKFNEYATIAIKTFDQIENIGTIDEIKEKIRHRSLKCLKDTPFHATVVSDFNEDEVIEELKVMFKPLIDTMRLRRDSKTFKEERRAPSTTTGEKSESGTLKNIENRQKQLQEHPMPLSKRSFIEQILGLTTTKLNYGRSVQSAVLPEQQSSISSAEITPEIEKENKYANVQSNVAIQSITEHKAGNVNSKEQLTYIHKTDRKPEAIKITKHYTNYNIRSKLYDQLSKNEAEIAYMKDVNRRKQPLTYQQVLDISKNINKNPNTEQSPIMKLLDFSIMKMIILLNTMLYSIETFEIKYSVASFECFKDCLKCLWHITELNDLLQKVFSSQKLIEIEKYFLPTMKICRSHFYAFVMSQTAEFIWSIKSKREDNDKELFYSEFIEFSEIFGTNEDIIKRLSYRNNDTYINLAQQVCCLIPPTIIDGSNDDIVKNIEYLKQSKKKSKTKQTQIGINCFEFTDSLGLRKCSEYEYLHLKFDQIEKLFDSENIIYNFYKSSTSLLNLQIECMREFCTFLKKFEEVEDNQFKIGTFVHFFINDLDNMLDRHVLRILVSHFYSFILHMIYLHYSNSVHLKSKADAKSYRRSLLDLLTYLCPIYEIPEKLYFRNDDFFSRYAKNVFTTTEAVSQVKSKKILKNISNILKENKSYLENFHHDYISTPSSFNHQISILEGKRFSNDELFYIRVRGIETEHLIHFKEFANAIMQVNLS